MQKALVLILIVMGLCACQSVKDDASNTPIGSVVSGKTKNVDTYVERVKNQNRAENRDVWRPTSKEHF